MSIDLKIPDVGESIQEIEIGKWLKQEGDTVEQDESLVELETDKASMELPSPAAGVLRSILKKAGERASIGDVIAHIDPAGQVQREVPAGTKKEPTAQDAGRQPERAARDGAPGQTQGGSSRTTSVPATPSARRALQEYGLTAAEVQPSGKRLRRSDVERHVRQAGSREERPTPVPVPTASAQPEPVQAPQSASEVTVPLSLIRRNIARRLVEAQHQAALLTTFNEIDMTAVMELRRDYGPPFQQQYGIKLGYMPFFVKAVIHALRDVPELNAEIREESIVYRNYYHIGIAVGGGKGLVVPVLRYAERLSFAEIEGAIDDFAKRSETRKLKPEELEGGTFTITNGGIYGSLLSTPIVNPPQSGVLGMHAIQERPVARQGQVVIRPMMYVALTYDHRIVDGREAVLFLRRVKEAIEEPARLLIEV